MVFIAIKHRYFDNLHLAFKEKKKKVVFFITNIPLKKVFYLLEAFFLQCRSNFFQKKSKMLQNSTFFQQIVGFSTDSDLFINF